MILTVLGASGSYPGPASPSSGYLVRGGGAALWLDAGAGTFAALQRHVDVEELSGVVLTHCHIDHWLDIAPLHTFVRYFRPDLAGLHLYGTEDTRQLADHLFRGDLESTFTWTTITDSTRLELDGLRLRFSRTDHPVETFAVRIDHDGRSMAFSADTGAGWSASALGPDLDLFLCEASLTAEREDEFAHLSGRQAGEAARAAGARRLVVTHLVPGVDAEQQRADAEQAFGGTVEVATPDAVFDV
jgi:ribonuclease BN (tRNA processing enzyme)